MILNLHQRRRYPLRFILQLFPIYLWVRTGFNNPLSLLLMPSEWINLATHLNAALKTFNLFSPFLSLYKLYPCIALCLYKVSAKSKVLARECLTPLKNLASGVSSGFSDPERLCLTLQRRPGGRGLGNAWF